MEEKTYFKEKITSNKHTIEITNREEVNLTGIIDLLSFDEELVICESTEGVLVLKGNNLHVSKLDLDNTILQLTGHIDNISYEDNHHMSSNRTSFLSKIFK